jgi:Phosphotransferase enzyme family
MSVMGVTGVMSSVTSMPATEDAIFIGARERWQMLGTLARMVEEGSKLERCESRSVAVLRTLGGAVSSVGYRDSTVLLPCGRSIRGEMTFSEPATLGAVGKAISRGRPAFVLKGTLQGITDFFRIDPTPQVRIMLANSGLFVCFGSLAGQDVVAYATSLQQYRSSIDHQFAGIGIGRKALGSLAPEVLVKGADRLIVSRLPGCAVRVKNLTESELQNVIMKGLGPLSRIYREDPDARGGGDQSLICSTLNFLRNHPHSARIADACERLSSWDRTRLPAITVHGDYWADNLLLSDDQVSGVVDWDRARELGCVGFDALTLGFMSYAQWGGVYVSDVLSDIWRPKEQWRYPWLHHYTEVVGRAFSLTQGDIQGLAILLWLSTLMFNRDNHNQEFIDAMYRPIYQA